MGDAADDAMNMEIDRNIRRERRRSAARGRGRRGRLRTDRLGGPGVAWVATLPAEPVSRRALDDLPEYSLSDPTGVVPGKVWKRNTGMTDPPTWVICEYVQVPGAPDRCKIEQRRPVVKEAA